MINICSSCKKKTEIVREDRDTEITLNEDGKPVKVETVASRQFCQECVHHESP